MGKPGCRGKEVAAKPSRSCGSSSISSDENPGSGGSKGLSMSVLAEVSGGTTAEGDAFASKASWY